MSKKMKIIGLLCVCLGLSLGLTACGEEADELGVGAQCSANDDCTEDGQQCLTEFKGGYCGVKGCQSDAQCPDGSRCVTHSDSNNYCFRSCTDKSECNVNRDADVESNCSSNVTFADGDKSGKACVPPSS